VEYRGGGVVYISANEENVGWYTVGDSTIYTAIIMFIYKNQ